MVEYEVWATADKVVYNNPEQSFWITVESLDDSATPIAIYQSIQGTVKSDVDASQATPSGGGQVEVRLVGPSGDFLENWYYKSDGSLAPVDHVGDIKGDYTLHLGQW